MQCGKLGGVESGHVKPFSERIERKRTHEEISSDTRIGSVRDLTGSSGEEVVQLLKEARAMRKSVEAISASSWNQLKTYGRRCFPVLFPNDPVAEGLREVEALEQRAYEFGLIPAKTKIEHLSSEISKFASSDGDISLEVKSFLSTDYIEHFKKDFHSQLDELKICLRTILNSFEDNEEPSEPSAKRSRVSSDTKIDRALAKTLPFEERAASTQKSREDAIFEARDLIKICDDLSADIKVLDSIAELEARLEGLRVDISEDISKRSEPEFTQSVAQQFRAFEEIASLRSEIKKMDVHNKGVLNRRALCAKRYKNFINAIPSFRAAAELKARLDIIPEGEASESRRKGMYCGRSDPPWRKDGKFDYLLRAESEFEERVTHSPSEKRTIHSFIWDWQYDSQRMIRRLDWLRIRHVDSAKKDSVAKKEWKEIWKKVQLTLLEGYHRARPLISSDRPRQLTWVTGTNSSPLVCMKALLPPEMSPALIPSGELLQYGIVPLTGELDRGVSAVGANIHTVGGCKFPLIAPAKIYADAMQVQGLFKVSSEQKFVESYITNRLQYHPTTLCRLRVKIAIMRLLFARAQGAPEADEALRHITSLLEQLIQQIPQTERRFEQFSSLVGCEAGGPGKKLQLSEACAGNIIGVWSSDKVRYGVITEFDANASLVVLNASGSDKRVIDSECLHSYTDDELASALFHVQRVAPSFTFETDTAFLSNLISMIEAPDTFKVLTDEDARLVRNPTGLIFGSFTLKTEEMEQGSPHLHELVARGPQFLGEGKDIQVVFVEDSELDTIKEYVRQLPETSRIEVVSMRALNYLTAAYQSPIPESGSSEFA